MTMYFSKDGMTTFAEKYKNLAEYTVEMPTKEEREGYRAVPRLDLDTLEGYWEYREIRKPDRERITDLEKVIDAMLNGGA